MQAAARALMGTAIGNHHIIDISDFGVLSDGSTYFVMEFLDGEDLDALLNREGPLPWDRVAAMGAQICSGLATAHRGGIVHRDIKPQNCFRVTVDDDPDHVKIIDFGVARDLMVEVGPTQQGFVVGTPEYMAPELLQSGVKANPRTDIYAVGVTLYKLLTGVVPYRGATAMATLQMHVQDPLVPPSLRAPHLEIPPEADDLVGRALAKSPEARHASADELARALRAALGGRHSRRHAMVGGPQHSAAGDAHDPAPSDSEPARRPSEGTPVDDSLRTSTLPWQAARPRGSAGAPGEAARAAAQTPDVDQAAANDPRSRLAGESAVEAGRSLSSAEEVRPVAWRTQRTRAVILGAVTLFFIVANMMISPEGPGEPPAVLAEERATSEPEGGAPDIIASPKFAPLSDTPPVPLAPPTTPEPERPPEVEVPSEVPTEPPVAVPAPGLPAEAGAPGEPAVVTPPEPSPAPAPAPNALGAAVSGEQAALPEPDFHYADAKKLIDEQAKYLRSVCLAKSEKPVTRLKLRFDARPNGRAKLRIFSGSKGVRECVRGVLVFPFDPSPRGGAFEYSLTETGSSLVRVPLDPTISQ